jgi:membrane associated rhomboid family serine protease
MTHDPRRLTPAVQILIAICTAIMFLQWTVVSDADVFAALGFQDGSLQRTLWSAVTYSFAHYGFWHLAVNMYALFAFGPRLEMAMGTRAFTLYYLWCALGGAIAHLLFVPAGILVGASAAVLGVMFGYAQQWPDEEVLLLGVVPVRAWTVVLLFAVANMALGMVGAGDVPGGDRVVYLAHLGGLAFGWLYFRTPPAASIERLRQRIIRTRYRREPCRRRCRGSEAACSATKWTKSWRRATRSRRSSNRDSRSSRWRGPRMRCPPRRRRGARSWTACSTRSRRAAWRV